MCVMLDDPARPHDQWGQGWARGARCCPRTTRSPMDPARPHTSAFRAPHPGLIVLAAMGLAAACSLLAGINPMLGIVAALVVLLAGAFSANHTVALCCFAAAPYAEVVTDVTGAALSPIKVAGGALILLAALTLAVRVRGWNGWGAVRHSSTSPAWSRHPVTVLALVSFVAFAGISVAWAQNEQRVQALTSRLALDTLLFLAIGAVLMRPAQLRAMAWTVLAAGACSTTYGFVFGAQYDSRFVGTFSDPNEFAAAIVVSLALGYGAVSTARSAAARRMGYVMAAICTYGLIASQSRGGLIAVVMGGFVIVATSRGRERIRMMGTSSVLLAVLGVFLVLSPSGQGTLDRMLHGDSSGRTDLWRIARAQIADQPLHGVGLGNYPVVAVQYITRDVTNTSLVVGRPRTTHNAFLEITAELGFIGISAFALFVGSCLLAATRGVRRARRIGAHDLVALGRALIAATCGVLAACLFLSDQYDEILWMLLAGCVAHGVLVARATVSIERVDTTRAARVVPAYVPAVRSTVPVLELPAGAPLPEASAHGQPS